MRSIVYILFVLFAIISCEKIEKISEVPEIDFKSFTTKEGIDTLLGNHVILGTLEFGFIDGDADLGVYEEVATDTSNPDSIRFNLFLTLYEKIDGNYKKVEPDPDFPQDNYTIMYNEKMDRVGQNKTVKGIIELDITYLFEPPYDTLKYDFYIRDRALNKSNVESTTDFIIEFKE